MARRRSTPSRVVVGIDPGSEWCGYGAIADDAVYVESGVWDVRRKKHEGGGMQMVRLGAYMYQLLGRLKKKFDVVLLAYEEIRFHGENAGIDAAHGYGGVIGQVTAACEVHDVPYTGIPPTTARKLATGRGDYDKSEVRDILEADLGVVLDHGDRRVKIAKKKRKRKGPKSRIKLGYDESDAVCVALAFSRDMSWSREID